MMSINSTLVLIAESVLKPWRAKPEPANAIPWLKKYLATSTLPPGTGSGVLVILYPPTSGMPAGISML